MKRLIWCMACSAPAVMIHSDCPTKCQYCQAEGQWTTRDPGGESPDGWAPNHNDKNMLRKMKISPE